MSIQTAAIGLLAILTLIMIVKKHFTLRGNSPILFTVYLAVVSVIVVIAIMDIFYRGILFRETFQKWAYFDAFNPGVKGLFYFLAIGIPVVLVFFWKWATTSMAQAGWLNSRIMRFVYFAVMIFGIFIMWSPLAMNLKAQQFDLKSPTTGVLNSTFEYATSTATKLASDITTEINKDHGRIVPPEIIEDQKKFEIEREKREAKKAAEEAKKKKEQERSGATDKNPQPRTG